MIDKEKAINLLNNAGKSQKEYLYRKQDPFINNFFFKSLNSDSYYIVIYENYEKSLVEDIIFRNEEEEKKILESQSPFYFENWTKELTDRMLKKFPSFSIQKKKYWWDEEEYNYIVNKWGKVIACYDQEKGS